MAPVTASPKIRYLPYPPSFWGGGFSLTWRILAVNIFALALFAGGFFYIDSYRSRVIDERLLQSARRLEMVRDMAAHIAPAQRREVLLSLSKQNGERIRLYSPQGALQFDSARAGGATYTLVDPAEEPLKRQVARFLDEMVDSIVRSDPLEAFEEPRRDVANAWAEVRESARSGHAVATARFAPDRTPMISAAVHLQDGSTVLAITNARDITRAVRAERLRLALVVTMALLGSIWLSLFLARTIVLPLRRLARGTARVRLGRARQVHIPRLPDRRDEIGVLARSVADMTEALRHRIDATDSFAADVSHELKNPIASLRSALDGLENVREPALQRQLLSIAQDDVRRLDRLVTDIAEASRIDAQLSRTRFEPVDLGQLIEQMILAREKRGIERHVRLAFARPRKDVAVVMGEQSRLMLVIDNLLDNAVSFSPERGLVQVTATVANDEVLLSVEDEGPGVPPEERETVFRRFHSVRPENEAFGKHSGLGLAIARSIVEGHQGRIVIADRENALKGARFDVYLPLATLGDPGIASE
ncbi:MAG: stimulus-sensing domain-containing protein [Sphingobium sp.]|jgi:two-component system sensor histidine kinase ChvG|nr:stimulus-sensing domain-containing protein [Sphingobium sp.]MCI1272350.1 stimulus-sensing domain-containing protein [Sphingobium sp.]MCI1755890.1 stimulus-sensing domain-containing protein [Sphingobium sp.]MCI2052255.1 stimulus-sensing domain-containing protein [Sphingobium sp.]